MRDAQPSSQLVFVLIFTSSFIDYCVCFSFSSSTLTSLIRKMVDLQTVCCMCGDVGFPDKLFRCSKCRNRFQHSYCSNYYSTEYAGRIEVCDWCQCEERNNNNNNNNNSSSSSRLANSSARNKSTAAHANEVRSAYSGDKIKQHHREEGGGSSAEKATGKTPSPRPTTRRYKLLKDVMC